GLGLRLGRIKLVLIEILPRRILGRGLRVDAGAWCCVGDIRRKHRGRRQRGAGHEYRKLHSHLLERGDCSKETEHRRRGCEGSVRNLKGTRMEKYQIDATVVGAGAVGLAVARALALAGLQTVVLEKNAHFGMETSARNSEVIHAGIYYPQGSLKAG